MKNRLLFVLWGAIWILCGLLGLIPEPEGAVKTLMGLAALLCFLPPFLIFQKARKGQGKQTLRLLRNLSAASLGLTVVLLGLNFASFAASEAVGNLLYGLLVILSSPMVCGGNWLVSLFLWACLLIASRKALKQ